MHPRCLLLTLLLPIAMASVGCDSGDEFAGEARPEELPRPPAPGLRLEREPEAREVFRRAFWRDPGPEDRILHAERREWTSREDGVREWQWFLELEPGPEFTAWLEQENSFGLAPLEPSELTRDRWPDQAPAWFPDPDEAASMKPRGQPHSRLTLFEAADGRLFAFDQGGGFAPTAP